jgi:hypothetical protein
VKKLELAEKGSKREQERREVPSWVDRVTLLEAFCVYLFLGSRGWKIEER